MNAAQLLSERYKMKKGREWSALSLEFRM